MIIFLIIAFILMILFLISNYFFNIAINSTKDKSKILSAEHNKTAMPKERIALIESGEILFDSSDRKDVYITSFDGLKLHGIIIKNSCKSSKWMIMSHGYFGNIKQLIGGIEGFYDLGYNLLIVDARACGSSEGKYIGLGYLDKFDLKSWVHYLINNEKECKIFLFGVSMGAATVMMCADEDLPSNVMGIIEDCGYSSMNELFACQARILFKLPGFPFINLVSLISKIRAGYWLGNVCPINHIRNSKLPILFIHGAKDTFISVEMAKKLYHSCSTKKEILIVENAGHGGSIWTDNKKYWNTIEKFTKSILTELDK